MGMTPLVDRITAVLTGFRVDPSPAVCGCYELTPEDARAAAEQIAAELPAIPDRTFVDDQGRRWEWCGGLPGTWAWRMTGGLVHVEEKP